MIPCVVLAEVNVPTTSCTASVKLVTCVDGMAIVALAAAVILP